MVSEQRFIWKCDDETCYIYDTVEKKAYFNVEVVDCLNEQQDTINILLEELVTAQQQGYVIGFLHKNGRCDLTPKELEDE